jgi:predicted Zn finger-like uncharacterized protein
MSLAARCPSCDTVFRVVQDQLRVSEGWVRCGRCAEVFNALENLVDLDADGAPQTRPPPSSGRERVLDEMARIARHDEAPANEAAPTAEAREAADTEPPAPARAPAPAMPAPTPSAARVTATPAAPAPAADLRAEPGERPAFVRRAERAERWRRPGVRLALGALALVAVATLTGQAALEFRDPLAARWPALRPALEFGCQYTGCRIAAPRAIEAISVESSGLVRVDGTALYRLSVVLRNHADIALAVPALDLSLTDNQGEVIARRVLTLAEIGHPAPALDPAAELPLHATLSASRPVSGYTIEIFYP